MSCRDHASPCPVRGVECGGLNDVPCDCPPTITPEIAAQLAAEGAALSDAYMKRTASMVVRPGECMRCETKDAEIARLREALEEALEWAAPFPGHMPPDSCSELRPTMTRLRGRDRKERLAALVALADPGNGKGDG